jgi:hypothetical protein
MEGSVQRYELNVALTPTNGYFNFPLLPLGSLGINANTNFASIDNLIYPNGKGGHVTFLHSSVDAAKFLGQIPASPTLGADINYNLLGFGKYNKKRDYFWSFGLNFRATTDMGIPKELFSVLKDFRNGSFEIPDVTLDASAYLEFALGFATAVDWHNLVVGGRFKFLVGLLQADASLTDIRLDIDKDKVGLSADGTIQAHHALMNFDNLPAGNNGGVDIADVFDYRNNFGLKNGIHSFGMAIDLGAEAKFLDNRLKVSAAVNDLGFIKWGKAGNFVGDMNDVVYEFRGIDFDTNESEVTKPEDGITFRQGAAENYSRRLSTTLNIGAEYNFFENKLGVGVLSNTRLSGNKSYSELTLMGTVRPTKWFTAAVSHSLVHKKAGIFGLALNFHPRAVNLFIGFDYLPSKMAKVDDIILPMRVHSFNTYIGLAFAFGDRSKPWK